MKTVTTVKQYQQAISCTMLTARRRFLPPSGASAVRLWIAHTLGALALGMVLAVTGCNGGGGWRWWQQQPRACRLR